MPILDFPMPAQSGDTYRGYKYDGVKWNKIQLTNPTAVYPTQSGQGGKFLTTNGAVVSWSTVPPGEKGDRGDKGDTGEQGVSVTLQGTKATIADLPAAPLDFNDYAGHGWIVTTGDGGTHLDGALWFWNLSTGQWNDIGKIVGPKGDKGDTGDQGPPGDQGDPGPAGTTDYTELLNKPTLFSGDYPDLTNKPTIPTHLYNLLDTQIVSPSDLQVLSYNDKEHKWANRTLDAPQQQVVFNVGPDPLTTSALWYNNLDGRLYLYNNSEWVDASPQISQETFSGDYEDLNNKPTLFSGDFNDLINVPDPMVDRLVAGDKSVILDTDGNLTIPPGAFIFNLHLIGSEGTAVYTDENAGEVYISTFASGGSSTKDWTFGNDGTLILPGPAVGTTSYSRIRTDGAFLNLDVQYGSLDNVYGGARVGTNDTDPFDIVTDFNGAHNTWRFGANGNITFPDNTVQTTAWTGDVSIGINPPTGKEFWYNITDGRTYVKYNGQWVDANPEIPQQVPADISELSDDLGLLSGSGVTSYNDLTDLPTLFSGNYNDLTNKPAAINLANYTAGNIYINGENRGLVVDAGDLKRVGFMKYTGMEASFIHSNTHPFQIGRVDVSDITTATIDNFSVELFISTDGKVGIGAGFNAGGSPVLPTERLDVNGNVYVRGSIKMPDSGYGAPTFTTRSSGTKFVVWPQIQIENNADYAIGIESGGLWNSVPVASSGYWFTWYGGTTQALKLTGDGFLTVTAQVETPALYINQTAHDAITAELTHGYDPNFRLTAKNGVDSNAEDSEVARFGIQYAEGETWSSYTKYVRGNYANDGYQELYAADAKVVKVTYDGIAVTGVGNSTISSYALTNIGGPFDGSVVVATASDGHIVFGGPVGSEHTDLLHGITLSRLTGATLVQDGTIYSTITEVQPYGETGWYVLYVSGGSIGDSDGHLGMSLSIIPKPVKTWTFDTDGKLTLPATSSITDNPPNNSHPIHIALTAAQGQGSATWLFRQDGKIVFPDDTRQTTAWLGSTDTVIKVADSFAEDQPFKSQVTADLTDGVTIGTWMGLPQFSTDKTWKFDYSGNLTFPDNTVQSTAWTGSIAYSSVTGTPTLATVATSGSYTDLTSKPTIYSSAYIGTTSLAFNRSSASQTLTGVSIDGNAATATSAGTLTTARNINGVSFDGSAAISIPRITDGTNTLKIVPAPTTLAGQAGDLKGNIAFTDTYLYYCKTAYGGTSYVATASSGQTAAYVRVRKSISYTPAAGWTITFGTPITITSVTDAGVIFGYDSWQLNLASSVSSTGGNDYVLTDTSNAIWVQIPWTTVAPAGTLTGTTLNSTVVDSSLTSVGTLKRLSVTGSVTADSFNTDQITVVGNRIATTVTNANLELEPNGTGNITISTGTIVGTQTTQNVFNTTAQTINFAGAATTLNIGYTGTSGSNTTNILTAAQQSGTSKTVNIGTGSAVGSTTNVNLGSTIGTSTVTVNGTLVGSATSQDVFNTTATTVNFAGAATTLNIGTSSGTINVSSAIKAGTGTYTKTLGSGEIALDNGTTDTPGVLMYYANNSNWGVDSYSGTFSVLSGQMFRVVNNLNESGGSMKMAIDTTGNMALTGFVQPGAWRAGQVIRDTMLSNSDFTVNATTVATSTSDTDFITYSYTPTSSSSYLIIHVHVAAYSAASDTGGAGTDSYFSRIKVDGNEITYSRQMTKSNESFRTGALFPLTGRYTNSNTTAKTITVGVRRDSADDNITIVNSATALWMRITEVAR